MTNKNKFVYSFMPTGMVQTNCTIIGNLELKTYILCDVGGDAEKVVEKAKKMGLTKCVGVFFTHGHFDHVVGSTEIKRITEAPLIINEKDVEMYYDMKKQQNFFGIKIEKVATIDRTVKDRNVIDGIGTCALVIHTPGHSPGSSCLYFEELDLLIAGDTLFRESYGKTEMWGYDFAKLKNSITEILFKLPGKTTVVTGHGSSTTIAFEKVSNSIMF
ncbi:beta lactamase domain, putative [Entamoeba invadens IP1]|uniref:Beta lactamase domain, putative n=1 Tax=Entamoeba invadens IP1 TaxID=370355 RepID=A0A0A1UD45_ENTIV|nr:beta lactamase domain, putative [Entamoeba invadens IP1]ELP91670.1 beta lactamase domain, putative [Entamoeba invadens IP1]|eukprot:XP_004258441.1 beta lactamase domain, putative [Entamoeba invadens IP1]